MSERVNAVNEIKSEIEGATSSMTSVPKPLKFLSPHFDKMKEIYEQQTDEGLKVGHLRLKSLL